MEIEQLRKEINDLLESLVEHCDRYTGKKHITSLEVNHVLAKTNNLQEQLSILKYLLEKRHSDKTSNYISTPDKAPVIETVEKQETIVTEVNEEVIAPTSEIPTVQEEEEIPIIIEAPQEEKSAATESVGDQIQQAPIINLADTFNLNDRYLYANELFNKDMNAFNELIKTIDNCASFADAQTLFNQTGVTNNWDVENQLVVDFMNLIERRFS